MSINPDILPNWKNLPRQNPEKVDMSGKNQTYGNPSFRAYLHLRLLAPTSNDFGWLWWSMISRDGCGVSFPDICLAVEEEPWKKPQPWKLTRPGIELGPAGWEATTVVYLERNTIAYYRDVKMWLSESFPLITSFYRFRCVRWNWGRTSWLSQKQPLQHSPNKRAVVDWPCLVISFILSWKKNILLLFMKARRNVWYVRKYWVWILISLCYSKIHSTWTVQCFR